jgi:hypothetical protein
MFLATTALSEFGDQDRDILFMVDGRGCHRIVETIASRMAAMARRHA